MRQSKTTWNLTEEAFARFLSSLDPDPARAGEAYELLRETLVKFLDWRGASAPEDLVDETFNRVARKLAEGETIQDLSAYCHGVARFVFLQWREGSDPRHVGLEAAASVAASEPMPNDDNIWQQCLKNCLQQLPTESRQLITAYYQNERRQKIDGRLALAEQLGIPLNALRSRAQRIRDKLEQCVMRCCRKFSAT